MGAAASALAASAAAAGAAQMADLGNAASNSAGALAQGGQGMELANQASARGMEQAKALNVTMQDAIRANDAAFKNPYVPAGDVHYGPPLRDVSTAPDLRLATGVPISVGPGIPPLPLVTPKQVEQLAQVIIDAVKAALDNPLTGIGSLIHVANQIKDALNNGDKDKGGDESKKFTPEQQDVIGWAKEAKKNGISRQDAEVLLGLAEKAGLPTQNHIGTDHWVKGDHIRVGPVNHIPVFP
jgi:hypothetical protein